jgi:hypothetical protein
MLQWEERDGVWTLQAENVTDYVAFAAEGQTDMPEGDRSSRDGDARFRGTRDFAEALKLAREGWAEGRAEVERLRAALVGTLVGQLRQQEYVLDVQGLVMDMGLVTEGQPECWLDTRDTDERRTGGRIVRVHLNGVVSANIEHDVIRARGAAVAALCDLLEAAGRRVELTISYALSTLPRKRVAMLVTVPVKQADEPLQVDQLAFMLMHPSALRRVAFSTWECLPADMRRALHIPGCYGFPKTANLEADIDVPSGPGWEKQWRNVGQAKQWLETSLRSQGIELEQGA